MKFISIGTANVDYIVPFPQHKKSSMLTFKTGAKYYIDAPHVYAGGGALNAAVTAARAGVSAGLVTEWGVDTAGSFLEHTVRREHIDPFITISRTQPTGTSFVFVSRGGERTIFVSHGALNSFSLADIPLASLREATWAYVVTGSWSCSATLALLRKLKKLHLLVACNPSSHLLAYGAKKLHPIFQLCDAVIMNRDEAALVTGINSGSAHAIFKHLDELVRGIAVMTDSKKGAFVSDGVRMFYGPAFKTRAVDETGAGDAFGSGFVVGLLESGARVGKGICTEEDMSYALHRASANAASVVEHVGATEGILSKKEFLTQKRWKNYKVKIQHLN